MKEEFIRKQFTIASLAMIQTLSGIVDEYAQQGYRLSLRQLYYQMVARALIENSLQSYKRLGDLVSNARLAGLLDWDMIEDRNRETITPSMWADPAEIVHAAARSFAIDRWFDQPNHVEVMVEKAALEGVLIPVCMANGVRFTANRGYSSSSAMYECGKRIERKLAEGRDVYVLYLGDHDPSGIDMTRDVRERLELFSRDELEVQRLALNYDQVEDFRPPENPAKLSDSRAQAYIAEFGMSSWELDAIEPATLAGLVERAIQNLRDDDLWEQAMEREAEMRAELQQMADNYHGNGEAPRRKKRGRS